MQSGANLSDGRSLIASIIGFVQDEVRLFDVRYKLLVFSYVAVWPRTLIYF